MDVWVLLLDTLFMYVFMLHGIFRLFIDLYVTVVGTQFCTNFYGVTLPLYLAANEWIAYICSMLSLLYPKYALLNRCAVVFSRMFIFVFHIETSSTDMTLSPCWRTVIVKHLQVWRWTHHSIKATVCTSCNPIYQFVYCRARHPETHNHTQFLICCSTA